MAFRASNKVIMISQYNRQNDRIYPLDDKGFRQAQRNNSHQIWTLLSWEEETNASQGQILNQQDQSFRNYNKEPSTGKEQPKKEVSFKISKNQQIDKPENVQEKQTKQKNGRENSFIRSSNPLKQDLKQKEGRVETQLQRLKRKSIQKYIKDQIPYTRTLSNSAFRKFYQRPCQEAYGRKNTHTERGAFYGNFMKTHNVQPHTLDNKPETYQTFTSALNFGKRTKLDLEDRWKRIERQLAKNLDYRELAYMKAVGEIDLTEDTKDKVLKMNIADYGTREGRKFAQEEISGLTKSAKSLGKLETRATFSNTKKTEDIDFSSEETRKAKSSEKPLYYIYKYQQKDEDYNCTRYARDRHGITCYVDNAFRENDEAYTQFLRNTKKIFPEKCRPEDVNIDRIRLANCAQSKEEPIPRHYLMPVVQAPYEAQKYSRRRTSSVMDVSS